MLSGGPSPTAFRPQCNHRRQDQVRHLRRDALGYPHSEGYCAAQTLIKAKKGETVPNFIDPADLAKNPLVVDKAWLDANPDFKAEWEG